MGTSFGLDICTRRVKSDDDGASGPREDKEDAFLLSSLPGSTRTSSEGAEVPDVPSNGAAPLPLTRMATEPKEVPDVPTDGAAPLPLTRMATEPDEACHANIGAPPSLGNTDSKASELGSNGPVSPGTSIGQTFLQYRSLTNWFNSPSGTAKSPAESLDCRATDDKTMASSIVASSTSGQPPAADQGIQWMGVSLNKWYCESAELPEHQAVLEQPEDTSPEISHNLSHFYDLSVEDDQQPQQTDRSRSFLQVRAGAG